MCIIVCNLKGKLGKLNKQNISRTLVVLDVHLTLVKFDVPPKERVHRRDRVNWKVNVPISDNALDGDNCTHFPS